VILMGAVVFLPRGVMGALRSLGVGAAERA